MTLVKCRDAGMASYTYFFKDSSDRIASPFFNTEQEANDWLNTNKQQITDTNNNPDT